MITFPTSVRKLLKDTRGVAAVEAAIIMPFLAFIGLATMDGSYMLLQNHKMEQALVSAANFMALSSDPRRVEGQAKQIAVTGTLQAGAPPLIKNWSTDDVAISYTMVANGNNNYRGGDFIRIVNISTRNPYDGFGIIKAISGNTVVLNAQYQQRMTGTTQ